MCSLKAFEGLQKVFKKNFVIDKMVEITFKDNKIQKGHRIKIPKAIVDTLEIKEGEKITIKFDPVNKRLIVEGEK